jgi:hypothetical protein
VSAYRLGRLHVEDEHAGPLVLEGDGFAAAGEISTLLINDAVAKYLGFSDAEVRRAREMVDAYRSALSQIYSDGSWMAPSLDERTSQPRAHLAHEVGDLIGAGRMRRLKALSWRILDGYALTDHELATRLDLTSAQQAAIATAARNAEDDNQRVVKSISHVRSAPRPPAGTGRLASPQPVEDAARDAGRVSNEQLLSVLTPDQRQRFDELKREQK